MLNVVCITPWERWNDIKDTEIKLLLKNALRDEINSAKMYMKGIDASYEYEGYTLYKTEELVANTKMGI